ncbi:C2 calcium-dependent membrane targeting [Artemisia annua]|uniref:C2 calcium-dependent membrane targeting n=1 Tax=Artemisia annua TaxID=35608 RepID=A0A2U1KYT0_ARTAN|nr:C2 calcium-dependent membrane targeting [Artemisia annua]
MECRHLELSLISAEGLKKSDKVYAVAYISETSGRFRTPEDKTGGSEPTWNHPMHFTIKEALGKQNRLTLVVKIKGAGMFFDKNLGEVRVPIKELVEGIKDEGDEEKKYVSYEVLRKSKKPGGFLKFSYRFGPKFLKPAYREVTAYTDSYGFGTGFVVGMVVGDHIASSGTTHQDFV